MTSENRTSETIGYSFAYFRWMCLIDRGADGNTYFFLWEDMQS